jgi:hypothetical protein
MSVNIVSARLPTGDTPVCSVTLEPYVLIKRGDTTVTSDDVPEEGAPEGGLQLRSRWYRSSIPRGGAVCSVHPEQEATVQCTVCLRSKVAVHLSYHCSAHCFKCAWQQHLDYHAQAHVNGAHAGWWAGAVTASGCCSSGGAACCAVQQPAGSAAAHDRCPTAWLSSCVLTCNVCVCVLLLPAGQENGMEAALKAAAGLPSATLSAGGETWVEVRGVVSCSCGRAAGRLASGSSCCCGRLRTQHGKGGTGSAAGRSALRAAGMNTQRHTCAPPHQPTCTRRRRTRVRAPARRCRAAGGTRPRRTTWALCSSTSARSRAAPATTATSAGPCSRSRAACAPRPTCPCAASWRCRCRTR